MTARSVVIADDDEYVRAALVELLGDSTGLRVVGVGVDADEAISLCRRLQPEVVVLDVNMPGGGGERAAQVLAHEQPELVIVALSAASDRATRRRMAEAGAVTFVSKSQPDELVSVVLTASRS